MGQIDLSVSSPVRNKFSAIQWGVSNLGVASADDSVDDTLIRSDGDEVLTIERILMRRQ